MNLKSPLRVALALLLLCLLCLWYSQKGQAPGSKTETSPVDLNQPAFSPEPQPGTAAKSHERRLPDKAVVSIGSYGEAEGATENLTGEAAIANLSKGLPPEGRRHRFSGFPDLRQFQEGDLVEVALPDGRVFPGRVNWSKPDEELPEVHRVSIGFSGDKGGLVVSENSTTHTVAGRVMVENDPHAWTIRQETNGSLWLVEHLRKDVICDRGQPQAARSAPLPGDGTVTGSGSVAPMLNSRPSATAVLLLDFDGEATMTYPDWPTSNPGGVSIAVPHSGLTADQMTLVWRRVAEDFIQFNINVTTDPAKYSAAPVGRRMRCITRGGPVSPPDFKAGLAWVGSFSTAGSSFASNVPCWVDISAYQNPATATDGEFSSYASNISHEIGHTLGLQHDGDTTPNPDDEYYDGHGSIAGFRWGSVMGSPYRTGWAAWDIIQWAKNDYPGANNSQDDLAIIANGTNGFGYAADESTGYISSQNLVSTGTYQQLGGEGVIANRDDLDWWSFQVTTAGNVQVEVEPADEATSVANLDCGFRIENNLGETVAGGFHIQDSLSAWQTVNLSPGLYHVVAYGTGNRQFSDKTGYDDYGSTGRYLVTVDLPVPPDSEKPVLAINAPANNVTLSSLPVITGTASDFVAPNSTGLASVKLNIYNNGDYWNGSAWTASQATVTANLGIGDGWSYSNVPTGTNLREGLYAISAFATDGAGNTSQAQSGVTNRTVTIDKAPPTIGIEPFANNSTIFNLDGLRISAADAVAVSIILQRQDGATTMYWSGTNWSSTLTYLPTTLSAGKWSCTEPLPNRANWPVNQQITIFASATDAANNAGSAQINVSRTAADTTVPVVTVTSPASGSVLTAQSLPALQGTAIDSESGIASVTVALARFAPGGVEFWNGSTWSASATDLAVSYDAQTGNWSAPSGWTAPSGSQLANMGYSIQVSATNREIPAATAGSGVNFSVDYHPVYTWTGWTMRDGNSENNSNSWGTPENWSPYGVPDVNDIAVIDNGDEVTSTVSRSVYGLKLYNGYLNFLNGPGPLGTVTTSKSSEWSGGTLRGIWDVPAGATLQLSGSGVRALASGCQLRNAGTVTWTGGMTQGNESVTITNLPGGVWVLAAAEDAFNNYYGGNQFINQGILRQTAAGNVTFNDWTFTLGGEIQKQGGTLVTNTNVTLPPGTVFSGDGGFRHESWTISVSGTITNPTGLFEIAGGGFGATAPAVLGGNYRWSGGAWGGTFTVPAGSDLSITGDCQLNPGSVLNNSGTVHWNSASPLRGYENVTVNNLAAGIWRLESTGHAFTNYYGGNTFNNAGLLEKTGAGETFLTNWTYAFSGHTKVPAGTLTVAANSSMAAGTLLSGAGTLDFNAGTCSLNGGITSTTTTLRQSGGVMVAAAGALIEGNWSWTGGSISGSLEIPVNRQLVIDGSCLLNPGTVLVNKGTVIWQGGIPLTGYENVTVTNSAGATWEFSSAGDAFNNHYGNNHFFNQGLMKRSAASGEVILNDWTYHHSGTFTATAGSTQVHSTINLLAGSSFTGAGSFSFHADTVLKGATTFTAQSSVAGGSFWGEETGLVHGTLLWSSATFRGLTKVAPGAFLRLVTTGGKALSNTSTIDNSGEIVWADGDLQGIENSSIVTRSGGFFRIEGGGSFTNYYGNNHLVIDDGGNLTKTNAAENAISWHFDNDGAATVTAGLLSLHNGGSSDGSFTGSGSGVLRFANGSHVLEGGASLIGTTEITGGSLFAYGNAGGRIDLKGGSTGGAAPAVFTFSNGSTWTSGSIVGLASVPNGSSLTAGGPDFKGLGGSATLAIAGLFQWNGGHPIEGRESSTIDVAAGGVFRVAADGDLFSNYYGGNRLLLSGTFEKTAGSLATVVDEWLMQGGGTLRPQTGSIDLSTTVNLLAGTKFEGTALTRLVGGTTTVRGTAAIQTGTVVNFAGASIVGHEDGSGGFNGGAIQWSAGWLGGTLTLSSATTQSGASEKGIGAGSVVRNAGLMTVGGTGQFTAYDNSELRNLSGATLHCAGTCHLGNYYGNNRLVNEGTVTLGSPHARQTMNWTFRQLATGTLAIEVGGENANTPQFDIIQGSGGFELAGKLVVVKTGGYAPSEDTTFNFLNGSGISGTFAIVQAPGFTVEYSGGSALLRAGNTGLGFEEWATARGLNGVNAQSGADPDYDGLPNFLEYAFNTDPSLHSTNPVPATVETIGGQRWVTLHYRRWQDRIDAGLNYLPQRSATLATWDGAGIVDEADPDAAAVAGSEARRCRIPFGSGTNFLRLAAE